MQKRRSLGAAATPDPRVEDARAVRIEDEVARRGIQLRGRGPEREGSCRVCGWHRPIFDTKKQVWNCRGCQQGGDVIALACHLDRLGFREAVEQLAGRLAQPPKLSADEPRISKPATPGPAPDNGNREPALRIWRKAIDPRGTLVETYLQSRGLDLPYEATFEAIRYQPRLFFRGKTFPAMIALVRSVKGDTPQAVHITPLVDPPEGKKRARFSYGPIIGGAIKLTPDADVILCLGIGEGIESALSLRCWDCFGASPVWSLITSNEGSRRFGLPSTMTLQALPPQQPFPPDGSKPDVKFSNSKPETPAPI
jgi:CHC2 zinc finger